MSTRPRPRPRPRPAAASAATPSSPGPSTLTPLPPEEKEVNLDDEDALFIRNRNRTAQTWKKLKQVAEEKESIRRRRDSSSDEDEDEASTPRRPKNKKKPDKDDMLPNWTRMSADAISLLSSDEDDATMMRRVEARTPNGKREPPVQMQGNNKRARSRSKSITPPPALPMHTLQHARDTIRQLMGVVPRAASPTFLDADESTDTLVLDPELASIAEQIQLQALQSARNKTPTPDTGGPENVAVKLHWVPHPRKPMARHQVWGFKMKRHDTFRAAVDEVADLVSVISDHVILSYDNKRVFPSATPHSLGIWAEAELDACDRITYELLQDNRRQRSMSIQPRENIDELSPSPGCSPSPAADELEADTGVESATEEDKFRLTLRSSKTKDVVLTVRPSTTCAAIIKAFLKKAGLAEQYAGASAGRGKGKKGGKVALMVDGDRLDPASDIATADLEDGDLVEVVGL